MSTYEELLNKQHGGYQVKEGEDALKDVLLREYILRKSESDSKVFDLLIPVSLNDDVLGCQLIERNVKQDTWYKLDEKVQRAPFRIGADTNIPLDPEKRKDGYEYIRVCKIENYEEHKNTCWSSAVNVGEQIYIPENPNDGGGWAPTVFYVEEVHNNYVTSSMDGYRNVSYRLRMDEYNHSWFTNYDMCVQACTAGGRL